MRLFSRIPVALCLCAALAYMGVSGADEAPAQKDGRRELAEKMAAERAKTFDASKLQKADLEAIIRNGLGRGRTEPVAAIQEAEERIRAIRETQGYTKEEAKLLIWPWVKTEECVKLIQQDRPLPEMELICEAERNGAMYSGGTKVFKGDAKRACEIMREIGLKDTANGKSWSKMWGHMERNVILLGKKQCGDLVVMVDVVLAVNQWDFIYKQVYNVRTVERYSEHDLGGGCYVIIQDLICDASKGVEPRGPQCNKKLPKKEYYPVVEQISITVIRDNRDGTFTLGNFMSTKAQPLEAITGGVKFVAGLFGIDLLKTTKEDTVKNRKKWYELFQKEVLKI